MMSRSTPSSTEQASDPLQLAPRKEEVSEEDDDLFMVPEMEDAAQRKGNDVGGAQEKRGRSRNTADREHKKIKRLLRNRLSAQQARERKKVYVSDMEQRARELQESNSRLEEKISTLINENAMLRKVLISCRPKIENADSEP
uniref:BZIP domain-containing protein n=1 Tax=Kalanchoe fedtschenkoi TaxID=63787 RepID=A0A7N0UBF5_KALFE